MAEEITRIAQTIASLDPRGYEQGVQKVEAAANRAVAANTRLEQSTEKVGRSTTVSGSAIDRLQAQTDKLYAAEQRREKQLGTLDRALQQGTVTQERYARVLQSIEQSYAKHTAGLAPVAANLNNVSAAASRAAQAMGLVRQGLAEAQPHLEQYSSQGGVISAVLGRLGIAGGLAAAAFGAFTLAVAKGVEEFTEDETAITRLEQVIRVTGGAAGFTAAQVETLTDQMVRMVGVSDNDVRRAATALAGFGAAGRLGFEDVIRTAADLTALFGGDLASNTERLGKDLQELATGATTQLGRSFHVLGTESRMAVEELARTGRGTEAAQRALDAMRQTIGGASESQSNTISGALRQSAEATGDLLSRVAQVTGATERARNAALSWRDAMIAVRDALTPSPDAASSRQVDATVRNDNLIGVLQRNIARAEEAAGITAGTTEDRAMAIRQRLRQNRDGIYRRQREQLDALQARAQGELLDTFTAGGVVQRAGYNGEEQAATQAQAARNQQGREEAAVTATRTRRYEELNTQMQRQEALARMAPDVRARMVAADNAETQAIQRLTGSQESSLDILRRLPAMQDEANQRRIRETRALAENTQRLEQNSQAGQQDAQQRAEARTSIEQQITGLHEEAEALGDSERERYITQQGLQAERTGRKLNSEELEFYVERVKNEAAALYDAQKARREAAKALEEQTRAINRSVDRVVDFAADGIDRILEKGIGSWQELWGEFVTLGRRAISQAIAEALIRPIVIPIVTQLVGSFGGMFGLGGAGAAGGALTLNAAGTGTTRDSSGGDLGGMSGLSSIGDLFSGNSGTLTPGLDNFVFRNTGFGQLANGQTPGLLNGGSATGGFASAGNLLGIAGAALPGLMSKNYIQAGLGVAGAAIGTAIFPGVGTVIGGIAGNLLGGLFGKKKPPFQVGTSFGGIGPGGYIGSGLGGTDTALGAKSNEMGGVFGTALQRIAAAAGGSITGGPGMMFGIGGTGDAMQYRAQTADSWTPRMENVFGKPEEAVQFGLNQAVPRTQFAGVGRAASYVLANQGATESVDKLIASLEQAVQFQKAYDAAIADNNETVSQAEQAVRDLNRQFDEMKAAAAQYGIGAEELEAARVRKLAKMAGDFDDAVQAAILGITDPQAAAVAALDKEREQAVKDATVLGANINEVERLYGLKRAEIVEQTNAQSLERIKQQALGLQQWLDAQIFGPASSSSPQSRFSEAQSQFARQLGLARGGDQSAIGTITGYADRLLGAGRDMFASSGEFGALESMTRSSIANLGSQIIDSGGSAEVVATLKDQLGQVRRQLEMISDQLRRAA